MASASCWVNIGQDLGVGAYLTNLRRTKIGDYKIENGSSEYLKNEYSFVNFKS